jgi:hypothetical protein
MVTPPLQLAKLRCFSSMLQALFPGVFQALLPSMQASME